MASDDRPLREVLREVEYPWVCMEALPRNALRLARELRALADELEARQ